MRFLRTLHLTFDSAVGFLVENHSICTIGSTGLQPGSFVSPDRPPNTPVGKGRIAGLNGLSGCGKEEGIWRERGKSVVYLTKGVSMESDIN